MPSWPIHIKIAQKLNKKLNLDNDNFIFGNILPDLYNGFIIDNLSQKISSKETHFRENKKINIEKFKEKYQNKLNNPIVLGYLTHLLADEYYNLYIIHKFHLENKNWDQEPENTKKNNILHKKHHDLNLYGNKLIKSIHLNIQSNNIKPEIYNITKEDIIKTTDYLNNLTPQALDPNYQLLTEKELDELLINSTNYIEKYLKTSRIQN